jgi:hypothetical protein
MLSVLLLAVSAGFVRRAGAALATAAMVAAVQGIFWWFSPWAARAYADLVGLPLRDVTSGVPQLPSLVPFALLPVAGLMELLYLAGRRRGRHPGRLSAIAGGIGGLLISLTLPLQQAWLYSGLGSHVPPASYLLPTAVLGGLFGLLGGFAGWRFGGMLCLLAPAKNVEEAKADA